MIPRRVNHPVRFASYPRQRARLLTSAFQLFFFCAALSARGATFVVTTTADSGAGSLRAAIESANLASNLDEIHFAIPANDPGHIYYPDNGVPGFLNLNVSATTATDDANIADIDPDYPRSFFRIAPTSPLPAFIHPVTVDGYTQGAATPLASQPNTNPTSLGLDTILRIELYGSTAGFSVHGVDLAPGSGGSTIRGLAIREFTGTDAVPGHGILIRSDGNKVEGCFIGMGPDGRLRSLNTHGIQIQSADNTIGGLLPAQRNLISGNNRAGLLINGGAGGNIVQGNIVGLNRTGLAGQGNFRDGIPIVNSPNNVIGGADPGARNVISNNGQNGVAVVLALTTGTVVQGNYIGTNVSGTAEIGNSFHGIVVFQSVGNTIGGDAAGEGNLCSGNLQGGITLEQANNNTVQGNILGTDPTTSLALGNDFSGVLLVDSNGNTIGGSQAAANRIAFNTTGGVIVSQLSSSNSIRANSIFSNTGLGIDLSEVLSSGAGDGPDQNKII